MNWKKQRHSGTVRLLHWVYAPAVLALIFSGLYIHSPSRAFGFKRMDSARKTHAVAQFLLLNSYLARVCYGMKDKNYKEIIPNRKTLKAIPEFLKYEFFLSEKKKEYPKYNPGQKILITSLAGLILVQMITGMALYFKPLQRAVKPVGGLNPVRWLHYLAALMTASSVSVHLYFTLTNSLKKLKSIFTGYA
ncbi:cytochrome b/b6 domain-containing protein [Dehalobacter restrictus]|uniref:Cytochrome b/b6 domain-containing protein n=1 Tax=Dehalobacter restrictus TaxID=55583 RepID=A0A857DIK8_9FIRM|nr:cytochrome b/b6 domain-containing protein [Dehalobacter restrictus]QHA00175.1 cytochrome b/b6 domain-containing protein [Dehalobacter restrictus]